MGVCDRARLALGEAVDAPRCGTATLHRDCNPAALAAPPRVPILRLEQATHRALFRRPGGRPGES